MEKTPTDNNNTGNDRQNLSKDAEIEALKQQISQLQNQLNTLSNNTVPEPQATDGLQPNHSPRSISQAPPATPRTAPYPKSNPFRRNRDESAESIIGKYALPVIATVLILIGVCFFAATIWETMPDGVKAGMVFLLGAVIAGAGLLFGRKRQMRAFRVSMVAVALAIAYIDIICMFRLWEIIGLIITAVLILIWVGLCAFLSCILGECVFHFCSITGLYISSILCYDLFETDAAGIVIILALSAAYAALTITYKLRFHMLSFLFGIIGCLMMINLIAFSSPACDENSPICIAIRILVYAISCCYAFFYNRAGYDNPGEPKFVERIFGCLNSFAVSLTLVIYIAAISDNLFIPEYLPIIAVIVLFCIKKECRSENFIGGFIPLLSAFGCISDILLDTAYPGMVLFTIIPLVILFLGNTLTNSVLAVIAQAFLAVISLIFANDLNTESDPENLVFLVISIFISAAFYIIYLRRQQRYYYSSTLILLLITITANGNAFSTLFEAEAVGVLTSVILLATVAVNAIFVIEKSPSAAITRIDLIIYGFVSQIFLLEVYSEAIDPVSKVFYILLLAASLILIWYSIGYKSDRKMFASLMCMSLLLIDYFVIVYQTFLAEYGFVISVGLLLIATCFIVYGFRKRSKAARLYGLVLVFVAVAKMLLIDIIITDQIMRVACLIGAGLICLAISFLYNKMEKKLKEEA